MWLLDPPDGVYNSYVVSNKVRFPKKMYIAISWICYISLLIKLRGFIYLFFDLFSSYIARIHLSFSIYPLADSFLLNLRGMMRVLNLFLLLSARM